MIERAILGMKKGEGHEFFRVDDCLGNIRPGMGKFFAPDGDLVDLT